METNGLRKNLTETIKFVSSQTSLRPKLGYVLGSGLGHFADEIQQSISIPYSKIPHFKTPKVEGHSGELILGYLGKLPVAVLKGRFHYFEGHSVQDCVYPVRTLGFMGVETIFMTNASGGILNMKAPGFMLITDQINLTGTNCLIGPNENEFGPRFPDMSEAYDKKLSKMLEDNLKKLKINYKKGVYCGLSGPTYETPAEIQMLKKLGVGAVGMSTVNEVIAARHMGIKCVGLSCITNAAAGIQKTPLNHEEVTENAKKVQKHFVKALLAFASSYKSKS